MASHKYLLYISQNYAYAMLRPLQAEILKRGDEVRWFLEGKEVSSHYLDFTEKSLANIDAVKAWEPDFVLVPGNIVPDFIPGIKVGLFHGFNSGKRGNDAHFKIRQCFDMYCTQGPNTTERFTQLSEQYKTFTIKETGWAMLDPLFIPTNNNPYHINGDERPTILVCSTFSEETSYAKELLPTIKKLSESSDYRWLVQFHPKMPLEIVNAYKAIQNKNLSFVETDNVIPLLQAADLMLCDTSSIMTMFLLQKKIVIAYKNKTRNESFLHVDNADDIEEQVKFALTNPSELLNKVDDYCSQTHPYIDGKSSERIINACEELKVNGIEQLKKKPLNIIRQLKLRKKLKYWKI
ncbi:CDP-glycerol--glycerophosphate glycerophosphotransferase [Psychromonas sp. RZ22]|uniref:UDP-N-acetylglucosamine 2-epimerase n=1 Tax=Psychromonas algarum TaxID=2555643 RepID=UPI0010683791|nr:UDP-N-acetylglucosamine 2-epimerase [Psychromonas sp. RZ22]TEW56617.1 CDP-glycerol--glycerophosphate glycerophosphotransferase [Psychromonas sp. RZ22]